MRRTDKELTDENIIHDILSRSSICRLGLVQDGEVYIVPVNYVYEDGFIYIHSAAEGKKIDIIRGNPHVSFEIEYFSETIKGEIACKWGTKYRSVMGTGTIAFVVHPDAKKRCLDLLMKKYGESGKPNYDPDALQKVLLLKLRIESRTGKQSGNWSKEGREAAKRGA